MSKNPWQTEATRKCVRCPGAKTVKRDSQTITDNLNPHPENKANDMQYSIIRFIYFTYIYIYIYTEPVYRLAKLSLRAMERDIFVYIYIIYLCICICKPVSTHICICSVYICIHTEHVAAWCLKGFGLDSVQELKPAPLPAKCVVSFVVQFASSMLDEIGWVIWYFVAIQWNMYQTNHVHCIFVYLNFPFIAINQYNKRKISKIGSWSCSAWCSTT